MHARGGQVQGGDTVSAEPITVPTGRERGDAPPVTMNIGRVGYGFKAFTMKLNSLRFYQAATGPGVRPCAICRPKMSRINGSENRCA